jgi:hypothetical protein
MLELERGCAGAGACFERVSERGEKVCEHKDGENGRYNIGRGYAAAEACCERESEGKGEESL